MTYVLKLDACLVELSLQRFGSIFHIFCYYETYVYANAKFTSMQISSHNTLNFSLQPYEKYDYLDSGSK